MEVRIGIAQSPRELSFETEDSADTVRGLFEKASENGGLVALKDSKGKQFLVNVDTIAYVELGGDHSRKVGFVS